MAAISDKIDEASRVEPNIQALSEIIRLLEKIEINTRKV